MKNKSLFLMVVLMFFSLCEAVPLLAREVQDARLPLYEAINRHDFAKAKEAIERGADVNAIYDRDSMLCWAIRNKNMDITRLILQSPKVDVNRRSFSYDSFGEWGRTPLILAAHMGQADIVGILLQMGAKVNAKDQTDSTPESRGNTALIKAAQRDHDNVIQVLIAQGKGLDINAKTKDGETALRFISEHEDLATLKLLHQNGAKISMTDNGGSSILVTTFLHKNYEVLGYLIANGADINHVDNRGFTPLMGAIVALDGDNKKTILKFLEKFITFKPNLDLQKMGQNSFGGSALHLAALNKHTDGIELLLDSGATIDIKNLHTGATPLHTAASANRIDNAKFLIKRKAKLDILDKSGLTPLMAAVIQSDDDMVEVLVDAGAAINIKSPVNILLTPLVYAASNPNPLENRNNLSIIKYLLSNEGDVDFQAGNGRTALIAAAQQSDTSQGYERAELLIDKGAKLDVVNNKGETALMLAAGSGNEKLVKLLIDKGADALKKNGAGETVMSYANRASNNGSAAFLESKGVKPEAPIVRKSVIIGALLGTWIGFQDGLPQAIYTVILNKNGTFDFNSKFTPEVMKQMKGLVKATIAAQKGTYTFNDDTMIWSPVGAPPISMKWKLENGMFIIDDKIRLKKVK